MADVNITVDTTASSLTGGLITNVYYVSNSAKLIIDQDFTAQAIVLGRNIAAAKSQGLIEAEDDLTAGDQGHEITFGTGVATSDGGGSTAHLWLYENNSGVIDSITVPVTKNDPLILKAPNQAALEDFLYIQCVGNSSQWTLKHYILDKPAFIICKYKAGTVADEANSLNATVHGDLISTIQVPRKASYTALARRGTVSRLEHAGYGPKTVRCSWRYGTLDLRGESIFKWIEDQSTKEPPEHWFVVTDREVLIDYVMDNVNGPRRTWEKDTDQLTISILFKESIL